MGGGGYSQQFRRGCRRGSALRPLLRRVRSAGDDHDPSCRALLSRAPRREPRRGREPDRDRAECCCRVAATGNNFVRWCCGLPQPACRARCRGEFLGAEMLVFGRALMGETVRRLELRDGMRLTRDGRPLLHDVVRIQGDAAALLPRPGVAGGMRAVATLLYVSADAGARLEALRDAFRDAEAGASLDGDLLVARVLAPSGAELRRSVETALFALRRRPLPRVWLC